jgi:hypothetical protein
MPTSKLMDAFRAAAGKPKPAARRLGKVLADDEDVIPTGRPGTAASIAAASAKAASADRAITKIWPSSRGSK